MSDDDKTPATGSPSALSGVRKNDDGSYTMCCSKKSCPTLAFHEDGSATISDEGQVVKFTAEQIHALGLTLTLRQAGLLT